MKFHFLLFLPKFAFLFSLTYSMAMALRTVYVYNIHQGIIYIKDAPLLPFMYNAVNSKKLQKSGL